MPNDESRMKDRTEWVAKVAKGQTDSVESDPGALRFVKTIVEFGFHTLSSVILLKLIIGAFWCL